MKRSIRSHVGEYYVYIMANLARTLYVGMTNNLERRVYEHKLGLGGTFTSRYKLTRLAYAAETSDIEAAISREKQIKGWLRRRKTELVESLNPDWLDLAADWGFDLGNPIPPEITDSSAAASE